ncbi:MAG: hypothetical protein CMJ51_04905 [Planctomycetaceae bacterium]|nr:hypothetical protein [Planctomycetaceae bacterium]
MTSSNSTATSGTGPLHAFNLVLITICVATLVAATVTLIALIWGSDLGDLAERAFATIGLVCVSSIFGLLVNRIVGGRLDSILPKICWFASWACIVGGVGVGAAAIWLNEANEDILLKTLATLLVLFIASTIGIALAGSLGMASSQRDS